MLDLLVLATIIGSLIPGVPVPHSLAPSHNTTVASLPRMPFGELGRTLTSYVGELLPTGGVPLAIPDFWSSKPPVRRTVCTSHGLRLVATPAQCLAIVSAQLGIPSPTDLTLPPPVALLTLPARRPLLTLPAAPRLVFLALPAAIHAPILTLPAPKHVPVLMLPAPKLRLTLSGPPDLIPPPAVLLPVIDYLYALPFPTSVAHAAQPSWKVPVDLSWSVSGARNAFATKYVVDARKVTVLVMAYLILLTFCWMLVCIKEDALDLAESFGWLVRCVWIGPPQDSPLARFGFGDGGPFVFAGWASTDAPDGLDADAFVPTGSATHRGPIRSFRQFNRGHELAIAIIEDLVVSTEASAEVAGEESPASKDANMSTSCDVSPEDSTASYGSIESTTSVSSFEVASEAEHVDAKDTFETEDAAPTLESALEAIAPAPVLIAPPALGSVLDDSRDDGAQDEGLDVGLSGPSPGLNDEEDTNGPRRRGKRGGRRVRKRRENALGGGGEGSNAGAEGTGEAEDAGGDGANGDGVSEKRERGFSSGIWFSHKRRREKRG
ncbi:hypothetical protein RhiJN_03233 [Ceratobasidium sp. AG-Ba]|nr:hypothetical protein RhiJN_03233 [Ceratobasidium sp. AG-Ba]